MPHPSRLLCLPYLPLAAPIQVGDWLLINSQDFTGPWLDAKFEKRSKQLLERFVGLNSSPLNTPAIVVSAKHGANGEVPNQVEGAALQLALNFGFVGNNPYQSEDNYTWHMVTTDNTELQIWPIPSEGDGWIAYPTGIVILTKHGGWNLDEAGWSVPCPLELHMPLASVSGDAATTQAIYEIAVKVNSDTENLPPLDQERHILTAISWWSKSWRNTPSVSWADRVVILKTAFEALLGGESHTPKAAQLLRMLFEAAASKVEGKVEGLLWSTSETPTHTALPHIKKQIKIDKLTDLEHWFIEFGNQRNKIIHEGITPSLTYQEGKSVYNGHLVLTADRVLREAVKLQLESLGYPGLWRSGTDRTLHDAIRAAKSRGLV